MSHHTYRTDECGYCKGDDITAEDVGDGLIVYSCTCGAYTFNNFVPEPFATEETLAAGWHSNGGDYPIRHPNSDKPHWTPATRDLMRWNRMNLKMDYVK